jgi:hypothetical protein
MPNSAAVILSGFRALSVDAEHSRSPGVPKAARRSLRPPVLKAGKPLAALQVAGPGDADGSVESPLAEGANAGATSNVCLRRLATTTHTKDRPLSLPG